MILCVVKSINQTLVLCLLICSGHCLIQSSETSLALNFLLWRILDLLSSFSISHKCHIFLWSGLDKRKKVVVYDAKCLTYYQHLLELQENSKLGTC